MQIDILTEAQITDLKMLMNTAQNIVVCGHKSPDGDALGASLAWSSYLREQQGKAVRVIVPDAFPDFLAWLPGIEQVIRYDKHAEEVEKLFQTADLIFCLDFGNASRVDEMQPLLDAAKGKKVMIDHHTNPDLDAVLRIWKVEASSTSELVFRTIWQLGGFETMSKACAIAIYCGMMTDTGGFTYNSSNPEIFHIISQLLTKGIDKDKIYRNVYNNYSQWAVRFRGYMMAYKLNVIPETNASYFAISRQDMRDYHFTKGDAEGLVNIPLTIKDLKLSISLREDDRKDNLIWVSLRSVDDFPCNELAAKHFNGGGHINASGGKLHCSLDEAIAHTRQVIAQYTELLKKK